MQKAGNCRSLGLLAQGIATLAHCFHFGPCMGGDTSECRGSNFASTDLCTQAKRIVEQKILLKANVILAVKAMECLFVETCKA